MDQINGQIKNYFNMTMHMHTQKTKDRKNVTTNGNICINNNYKIFIFIRFVVFVSFNIGSGVWYSENEENSQSERCLQNDIVVVIVSCVCVCWTPDEFLFFCASSKNYRLNKQNQA